MFDEIISIDFDRQADDEADEGHDIDEDVGVKESCESLQFVLVINGLMCELICMGFVLLLPDEDERCDEEDEESEVGVPVK